MLPKSQFNPSKPTKPQPQVECVENVVVVWLDQSVSKIKDSQKSKTQLLQIVNSVKIFTNPEECQSFMSTIKDEKLLVVLSGAIEEKFVSSIHDSKQLESIYFFCPEKSIDITWIGKYSEIRGIYTTILSLCEQLSKDMKKIDHNLFGFEVMEQLLSKTASKTDQQDAIFMYDHLFRDIVLASQDENMRDIYEFCGKQYQGNSRELSFLQKLKRTYSSHSPIWWYTQESFLYRMLNKALRTHQYDILYLLRVFIRHLHEAIAAQQKKQNIDQIKLFRGQSMDKADFHRIHVNKDGLLCVSNFLSTSSDREIGLRFAREALHDRNKVSILMEITVNNNTMVPVANITNLSAYEAEKEWLFSMGSVFRIGSIECLSEGIWVVPLTLTDDENRNLSDLKQHFKRSMADTNVCSNFARLMYQLAAWRKSEYFYLMALETETTWQRRSVLFNNLAMVKDELKLYDEALAYYHKSLKLKEMKAFDSSVDNTTTYNNIATLYYKQKKMDQAIKYFQKAIEDSDVQGKKNEELVATLYANIAAVLNDQGKHEEALEKCEESLKICVKIFPSIHPSIASTYDRIAYTMHYMGSHAKAIEYAQKAVDIDRQALPLDHPQTLLHMEHLKLFKEHETD